MHLSRVKKHRGEKAVMINIFKSNYLWVFSLTALIVFTISTAATAKTYHFGAWRVKVTHDRFANVDYCHVYGKNMTTEDGIVSLNFQHDIDTDAAWYRIDGDQATKLSSLRSRVDALSAFPERGPLENPSNGQAKFPVELLLRAHNVDIRTPHPGWVKHFRVDGLNQALAFTSEHNCGNPPT
jgi:hypothetical protein